MSRLRGPSPTLSVALELARALGGLVLLPVRALVYRFDRQRQVAELERELHGAAVVDEPPVQRLAPASQRCLFVSCAEASGEIHAVNLIGELRRELAGLDSRAPRFLGLGGARLEAAGVELVGRPVERAVMGFDGTLRALPFYLRLLRDSVARVREARAQVAVLVDSPALHVPLGRMLRRAGVPVVHFVTPQHWGWAPWRSRGYPSAVDLALAILPFERNWFRRRGVRCDFVGHPLLDELPERSRSEPEGPRDALVVLAGSREGVLGRNLPWMWSVLAELRQRHPDLRIVVAHDRPELGGWIERELAAVGAQGQVELALGDLHRTLEREARAAFSVSGTVLLDLLHQRLPCVVIYRLASRRQAFLQRHFLTAPYIASINLLAAGRVVPEHAFAGEGPRTEVIAELERALFDEAWRAECRLGLERAAARLGSPGACARAARAALNLIAPGPVRSDFAGSKSS